MPKITRKGPVFKTLQTAVACAVGVTALSASPNTAPGSNQDPSPGRPLPPPYEMAGRAEAHPPALTFEDCSRWLVESVDSEARLYRSGDRKLFRDGVGKLVYRAAGAEPVITLRPAEAPLLPDDADAADCWSWGSTWGWERGNPHLTAWLLLTDADGAEHALSLGPMFFRYWHLQHVRIPAELPRPVRFTGLRFTGGSNAGDLTVYLDSIAFYRQSQKPLHFPALPKPLPFPIRPETVLPPQAGVGYASETGQEGAVHIRRYRGTDTEVEWRWDTTLEGLDGLSVTVGDVRFTPCAGAHILLADGAAARWRLEEAAPDGEALLLRWQLSTPGDSTRLTASVRLMGKSLVLEFSEEGSAGRIAEFNLGKAAGLEAPRLIPIPYLAYGWAYRDPQVLLDRGVFFLPQFDWYVTDASEFFAADGLGEDCAEFAGGVRYFPRTDGVLNPLRERLFLNVSPELDEVLPSIPNPPSPNKEAQARRQWRVKIAGHSAGELAEARRLRSLGLEQVTIRYHENLWRDDGESFTFRTAAAPGKGGDEALRAFVRELQALDWQPGLYTNYTDLAPVNAHWDEDHAAQWRDGNWITGWARCYQPKPWYSWIMEAELAPQIHAKFGNRHVYCDVHTAVSPWERTDYDARVPGAAKFRTTYECFGMLLLNERRAYRGTVYSEGGCHWMYAGLVDGNYAQMFVPEPWKRPWLPDFDLRRLHPLEMDAGMGSHDMFFRGTPVDNAQYIAATLVYGHIGFLDGGDAELMQIYYLIQPLQRWYVMEEVESIAWFDRDNRAFTTSEALKNQVQEENRVRIRYRNGFTLYANGNAAPWEVEGRLLPRWGWLAFAPGGELTAACETVDGRAVSWCFGPDSLFLHSPEGFSDLGPMAADGSVAVKREGSSWRIIPATEYRTLRLDPAAVGCAPASGPLEFTGYAGPIEPNDNTGE